MCDLDDLDVICSVLGCEIGEILIPDPDQVRKPQDEETPQAVGGTDAPAVTPKRRDGRSLPPI